MIEPKKAKMLIKKKIVTKGELNSIKELLEYASGMYYNKGDKYLSDGDYDHIYERYLELGGKELVGAEPPQDKKTTSTEHKYQELVGTTLKAHNLKEFNEWIDDVYKKLNLKAKDKLELYATLKFDGGSIVIEYDKKGNVLKSLTRGRNGKGVDKTSTFKDRKINNTFNRPLAIKYECIMFYSTLDRLNNEMNHEYKNPRTAANGKLNADESVDYKKYFTLEPLWIKVDGIDITREEEIEFLESVKDTYSNTNETVEYLYKIEDANLKDIKEDIASVYEDVLSYRKDLDFMIDGIVVDVIDKDYRDILGVIDGGENLKPKWCIAIKFPYLEEESYVECIKYSLGDSGRISPVCYFHPIKFIGGTHRKQYLQGYKRFNELQLCKGTRIRIEYHNDTLSYIERLDTIEDDKRLKRTPIPFIDHCPVCGENQLKIVTDSDGIGTSVYCTNPLCCGTTVGRINNFFKKMDIKGTKENTIKKLHDAGIWNNIIDLFTFNPEDAYEIEGLGSSSINKIVRAINRKEYYDYEILGSLGILHIGLDTTKNICMKITLGDIIKFIQNNKDEELITKLISIDGVAEKTAKALLEGIKNNMEVIEYLMKRGYKDIRETINFDDNSYTFVITGDLNHCGRDVMKKILTSRGHKLTGSVSGKTDYLVTNFPLSGTTKIAKAKELGKPIIDEDQLIDLLQLDIDTEVNKYKQSF